MTIYLLFSGGTLSMGLWRLAGTLIGAFTAWAVLEIDGTSGCLLSGFAFILGNILHSQNNHSYNVINV
jgi:uncharacterized membrane protein YccC